MTRLWLPVGRRVLLLITLLIALLALLPMRLVLAALDLDRVGVSARGVSGSVWRGRIDQLSVAGLPVGDVYASLSPWYLLVGKARIHVSRPVSGASADRLSGSVTVSRNRLSLNDASAVIPLAAALQPLPLGNATLNGLNVRFDAGACTNANGSVHASVTGGMAGVVLAQGLTGVAACDGRWVRLPLTSQAGRERLDLRIAADGEYQADLYALDPAPDRVAGLIALGFQAVPGGLRLRSAGRF